MKRVTLDLAYIALAAVIIAVCSWVSVPTAVPFTLQTFAVFFVLSFLGGKRGTAAILVYLLLGAIGVPVFSNFQGGAGALLGPTGGYLVGFLFIGLIHWLMVWLLKKKLWVEIVAFCLGIVVLYTFGTVWFMIVYARKSAAVGLFSALSWCVFPFIAPDLLKMTLALLLARKMAAIRKSEKKK